MVVGCWAALLVSMGWLYWRSVIAGELLELGLILGCLALLGLVVGWFLQFRTHLIIAPFFAADPVEVSLPQARLGAVYRTFLESVSSASLRRLGAQLAGRASRLLILLADHSHAETLLQTTLDSV